MPETICARCEKPIFPEGGTLTWLGKRYHPRCWGLPALVPILAVFILASLARPLASSTLGMTCVSTTRTVAFCSVPGDWNGAPPKWRVLDYETGEVIQESEGLRVWPQADERLRIIELTLAEGETDHIEWCWLILSEGRPRFSAFIHPAEMVTQAAQPP